MLLAQQQPSWLLPMIIVGSVFVWGLVGWSVLLLYRWFRRKSEEAQQRAFNGVVVYDQPMPGAVGVVFHSYYGFIVFVTQTEHRFWARPKHARLVLWRLHRFNMSWGAFAYGAIIIPGLSYLNYLAQKRSIRNQETQQLV
jgi:hypothetical protein